MFPTTCRYVDVLTAQLQQKLALCDKLATLAAREKDRQAAARQRAEQLRPLLAKIIARTKELQDDVSYITML